VSTQCQQAALLLQQQNVTQPLQSVIGRCQSTLSTSPTPPRARQRLHEYTGAHKPLSLSGRTQAIASTSAQCQVLLSRDCHETAPASARGTERLHTDRQTQASSPLSTGPHTLCMLSSPAHGGLASSQQQQLYGSRGWLLLLMTMMTHRGLRITPVHPQDSCAAPAHSGRW
jgi:hypothetical protein